MESLQLFLFQFLLVVYLVLVSAISYTEGIDSRVILLVKITTILLTYCLSVLTIGFGIKLLFEFRKPVVKKKRKEK